MGRVYAHSSEVGLAPPLRSVDSDDGPVKYLMIPEGGGCSDDGMDEGGTKSENNATAVTVRKTHTMATARRVLDEDERVAKRRMAKRSGLTTVDHQRLGLEPGGGLAVCLMRRGARK